MGKHLGHLSLWVPPSWGGSGVLRVRVPKGLPKSRVLWEQLDGRTSALTELELGAIAVVLINVDRRVLELHGSFLIKALDLLMLCWGGGGWPVGQPFPAASF